MELPLNLSICGVKKCKCAYTKILYVMHMTG